MAAPSQSRYDQLPTFTITDARRGVTAGRVPRRTLQTASFWEYRIVPPGWFIDTVAHQTQGSMHAWWRIMDTNPEYMHPWDIGPGDTIRMPMMK